MKVKRIYACLFCGIRVGKASSAFCHVDAKKLGEKLMPFRLHGLHYFQWSKLVIGGPYDGSIALTPTRRER